ncbi:olfactory receptor 56A5-like [Protopterus annectens]|uniref:olfactory receptor 56A5-like n=1 Tax=Protopterus annectens TaxID=7888 RepID=UPI001CFB828A|nr:olfactory receptor 56A5-like [Protopterus annectens]
MSVNGTIQHKDFILIGFPGFEDWQIWLSFPFCVMYIVSVLGNLAIIIIIRLEKSLHEPMYTFMCLLGGVDIIVSTCIIPKMLAMLWFKANVIAVEMCALQLFILYCFLVMETSIFVIMSYDRYIAICNPLRYTSIMTKKFIAKMGLLIVIKCVSITLPLPILTTRLSYCSSNVIAHCYCETIALMQISCSDLTVVDAYISFIGYAVVGLDGTLVTLSYYFILRTVLQMKSKVTYQKAISTCTSHIIVISFYYTAGLLTLLVYKFGNDLAPHIRVFLSVLYPIIPTVLNPIIYGARTKDIRQFVFKHLKNINCSL